MKIQNYPIFRLLFPFVVGIFFAYFTHFGAESEQLIFGISLCILLISNILYNFLPYKMRPIATACLCMSAFVAGTALTNHRLKPPIDQAGEEHLENCGFFAVSVIEQPAEKAKSVKIVAKIVQDSANHPLGINAVFYFAKDSAAMSLQPGDRLLVQTKLSSIAAPQNPYCFDNQKFMNRRGIFYTGYVRQGGWTFLEHRRINPLKTLASGIQKRLSSLFADNGLVGDEYAVITAVLLGNDETMDPELKARYSSAGVSHILCVSGMHVGIIFMIINFLLKPLDYSRRLSILKAILLLIAIWFYAEITGLSPSVKRAATMFTFVTIGGLLRRNANIFHSLFASLFILLLSNPLLIFEIGFQMSYLAVFGIVIFQPKIVSLYKPKTKLFNYFWELMAVSVAAQLATFPLSVFYFGQFPNYFLLANLSVIALSFVVVVTGVILLATSWLSVVSNFIAKILTLEIKLLNTIVTGIDGLPGAVTENISFSFLQVAIIYAVIISAFLFWIRKAKIFKYTMLIFGIILGTTFTYDKLQSTNNQGINIYSIEKMSAIGFNDGGQSVLLMDSAAMASPTAYSFNIKSHERRARIRSQCVTIDSQLRTNVLCKNRNFVAFGTQTMYIMSGREYLHPRGKPVKVDYLYLRENPRIPMKKLMQTFDFKEIIIDGTNSQYYESRWADSCRNYRIPCHSTRADGYYFIKNTF